jgi:hypothetical protein
LRKWACEGLSYLTLDADVKEKMCEDEVTVKALIELAKTGKQDCAYGVVTCLVNMTNSFEKEEIMPEMLELAKFAKHHIPQDHELDDPDFIDKRIWVIILFSPKNIYLVSSRRGLGKSKNATSTSVYRYKQKM